MTEHKCFVFTFADVEVREREFSIVKAGQLLPVEPKAFRVLLFLLRNPHKLIKKDELLDVVWSDCSVSENSLTRSIALLRRALGDDTHEPRYIATVPTVGYRFLCDVEAAEDGFMSPTEWLGRQSGPPRQPSMVSLAPAEASSADSLPALPPTRRRLFIGAGVTLALLLVAAAGLSIARLRELRKLQAEAGAIRSLAVLPFENLSGDSAQEYLTDGLTDELISDMGRIGSLRVISRTSVMRYKGRSKSLPEIAQELNVDGVVEGSVKYSGDRIRVNIKLVHARTDQQLWSNSYEREAKEIFRLEDQMALAIAHEVSGQLIPAEETRLGSGPKNPQAFDAYLRGRSRWNERDAEAVSEAIGYFEQALREDPDFALAYSGLADCYTTVWQESGDSVPIVDLVRGEQYARKALVLQPDLAEAHASLGINHEYQRKFQDVDKELSRAIELSPNYAMARHWYAAHLLGVGRTADAFAENNRALQLDPFSFPVNRVRGIILISLHQYGAALEHFERLSAINPQWSDPHEQMARIYWLQGRVPDALAEERKASTLDHSQHGAALLLDQGKVAAAYRNSGLRAAQLKSAQLKEGSYKRAYDAFTIALQYGALGDERKVLDWLIQAQRDNEGPIFFWQLKGAPEFDLVRSDPRFQDLLRRIGLPP